MNYTPDDIVRYLQAKARQREVLAERADAGVDVPPGVLRQSLAAQHRAAANVLTDIARDVEERAALGLSL